MKIKVKVSNRIEVPFEEWNIGDKIECISTHGWGLDECMDKHPFIKGEKYIIRSFIGNAQDSLVFFVQEHIDDPSFTISPHKFKLYKHVDKRRNSEGITWVVPRK